MRIFSVDREIQRQRYENQRITDEPLVMLGDGRGNDPAVNLYADKQHLWARDIGGAGANGYTTGGLPFKVLAGGSTSVWIGKLVHLVWRPGLNEWMVAYSDPDQMDSIGMSMHLENPNDAHNQYHRTESLLPFRAQWIGGLKISVQGYQGVHEGQYVDFHGTSLVTDDAPYTVLHIEADSYIPVTAAHHAYLLVAFNYTKFLANDNPLDTFVSTSKSWLTPLDRTDIQDCINQMAENSETVWVFRVATGDTDNRGHEDDRDLRGWLNVPQQNSDFTLTIEADSGDPFDAENGDTVVFEGAGGIDVVTDDTTKTVIIDGSGIATGITQLTGDVTAGPGSGSQAATLATVNGNVGTFTNATVTADGKGRITAIASGTPPVTSVGLALPSSVFNVSGSPVTTTGTLTGTFANQSANTVLAGPTSGSATVPAFRALVAADMPEGVFDVSGIAGEDLSAAANKAVYQTLLGDGKWRLMDASFTASRMSARRGILISGATTNGAIVVRLKGPLSGLSGFFVDGYPVYADAMGALSIYQTNAVLDGSLAITARLGYATSSNAMYIDPAPTVTYRKTITMDSGDTYSMAHHVDPDNRSRRVEAATIYYDTSVAESYAGSADVSFQLRGQSGAGAAVSADTAGGATYPVGDGGGTDYRQAQSLVLTAGQLSQVTFTMLGNTGTPTGGISISLRADNAGIPATTSVWFTSVSVAGGTLTIPGANTINISGGPFITAGTYWLVFECLIQSTNNRFNISGSASSVYAGGLVKADTTTGASFPGTWVGVNASNGDLRCSVTTSAVLANDLISQGISHGADIVLTSLKLSLRLVGSPTGNLVASIYSNSGGSPNTLIANGASSPLSASALTASYALREFLFPVGARPTLTAGTQYHIVLSTSDSASNVNYVEVAGDNTSPLYGNGQVKLSQSSSWVTPSPAADASFEVYAQSTEYIESLWVGQWSGGGNGQIGVRYGTTSSTQSTVTEFINMSGDPMICVFDVIVG